MGDPGAASEAGPPERERLLEAKRIFLEAQALAPAHRAAHIERACAADPTLRVLVDALMRGAEETFGLDAMARESRSAIDAVLAESPGTVIGPYTLVRQIGEGGFGSVFLAEQASPIRRTVALKILKLGMDSRQIVARFEQERQAMALMDHPSIAKVYDAGTTRSGRPYFVMEFCTGLAVTEYCDRHRLPIRERLELFVQICDAIQHAHHKGVIHRDIKPHNVLVDTVDARPVAKVIDFGIAKATERPLTERTLLTEQYQLVGTPEYMSPEQAEGSLDIDTRTDVYSLGVLLYELLTGTTPFDSRLLRSAAIAEIYRIIRDVDPPSPSVRLRSVELPLGTIADVRATPPAGLRSTIRGDLDWVVMKALDKDRSRRYDSAGLMARDIRRYLVGETVDAAPPSAVYRARKFIRRNRVPVVAAALLAISVVGGLVGTAIGFLNAEQGRTEAVRQKTRADENAVEARQQAALAKGQAYLANIGGAIDALDSGQVARARTRLAACEIALRGWEWSYASQMLDTSVRWLSDRDQPGLTPLDVDCSPGRGDCFVTPWFSSAPGQSGACIFDARTCRPLVMMQGHSGQVNTARFSPDGSRVVTASADGSVRVFDAATGLQTACLLTGSQPAALATFDPSGDRIIVVVAQDAVRVFEASTQRELASIWGGTYYTAAALPTDHRILLTRGFDGPLLWDAVTSDATGFARIGSYWTTCNRALPNPDGRRIAVNSPDQTVRILDLATGHIDASMRGHTGILTSFAFDGTGGLLATASEDGTVRVWHTSTGDQKRMLLGHRGFVRAVDFSPDASMLYTAGDDGVRAWNVSAEHAGEFLFTADRTGFSDLVFTPDGTSLVAANNILGTRLFDARTLALIRTIDPTPSTECELSSDGRTVAIAAYDGYVRAIEMETGDCVAELPRIEGGVCRMAISPDGTRIVVSSWSAPGALYELHTGRLIATLDGMERRCHAFAFSPDGSELLASTHGSFLRTWRTEDGKRLDDSPIASDSLRTLRYMPDGLVLSSGQENRPPTLWDPRTGARIREFRGHDGFLRGAEPLPDGSRIASCARDGTVRLWDPQTGEEVAVLRTDRPFCEGMVISPDGSTIAVFFEDTGAQFFRTERGGRR